MIVFGVLLLVCGSLALPWRSQQDVVKSRSQESTTRFLPSLGYTYDYVGITTTGITGSTNERTEIKIEAQCQVKTVNSNVYELKVWNVQLMERATKDEPFIRSKQNLQFAHALQDDAMTFKMDNGRITEITSVRDEPVFATNIKKGILSALQLEFRDGKLSILNEVDVTGECPTRYVEMNDKKNKEIIKTKNLTECTKRSQVNTFMHPVYYKSDSTKKTLLDSSSSCRYIVAKSQHIELVDCKEMHLLRPFSYQSAGLITNVTQKLTLKKIVRPHSFGNRIRDGKISSLQYDFQSSQTSFPDYQSETSQVEKTLKDLVESTPTNQTPPRTPVLYTKLVFELRRLDIYGLSRVWQKFYKCVRSRKFCLTDDVKLKYQQYLVDAFSQCGTVPCARFITQLIQTTQNDGELKESHVTQLLTGMAWMRKPTDAVLNDFLTLLKTQKSVLPKNTITILGSMIRTYCDNNPRECDLENNDYVMPTVVLTAMRYLVAQLGVTRCQATRETVEDVIYALIAIGNSRYMEFSPGNLVSCARESNYKSISVTALRVMNDLKLDHTSRLMAKKIYIDYSQDPELRMMAYLTWMKTPSKDDVQIAVSTLEGEINTQVGALVWSHLKYMNESVEPTNGKSTSEVIKEALRESKPIRKFNITSKSMFWEKSMYNEYWNLGMSTQGYIMYHPESFLPRSSHINVTMDILGGAFPFLEANTRIEGLESMWERLFGPNGHFPDNHIAGLVKTPPEPEQNRINKRSLGDDVNMDFLDSRVNMPKQTFTGLFNLKLFGNDLALFTFKDLEWLEDNVPLSDVIDLLRDLSRGIHKTFTKSLMFMHDSYVVPTCLGLPLSLDANGTAVGSAYVTGKADLLSLFWGKKNLLVKGTVKPTAVVSVSARMSVGTDYSMMGVQLNGTLLTSTLVQGNMTYNEKEKFKFYLNVTDKPQEILKVSTQLFKQMNKKTTVIKGLTHRNTTGICTNTMMNTNKLLGLDLCTNVSIPVGWYNDTAPMFPLSGPGNLYVTLRRSDPKLTTIKIERTVIKPTKYTNKTYVTFSTPKATFERVYHLNMTTFKRDDFYRRNISIGTRETHTASLDYWCNTKSKDMNVTLMFNPKAKLTLKYFRKTCPITQRVTRDVKLNVTVADRNILYRMKIVNDRKTVQFNKNISVSNVTTGIPITVLFLNSTVGYYGNMPEYSTLNVIHSPLNFTWRLTVVHNATKLSTNMTCNMKCGVFKSKLLNHNLTINISYVNTTVEKGVHVNLTLNGTHSMLLYAGRRNYTINPKKKISTYIANCTVFNKTTSLKMTLSKQPNLKMCHVNVTYQNRSLTLNTTWDHMEGVKKVNMNITYLNQYLVLRSVMDSITTEKGICFNGAYYNGTTWNTTLLKTCFSYLNTTMRKSLIWNITSINTTYGLNATWFIRPEVKGIIVNYTCQNVSLANFTVAYSNTTTTKSIKIDGAIGKLTLYFNHSYFMSQSELKDQLWSINITQRIKNGTRITMNNTFFVTFFNSTMTKMFVMNLTFWNQTYGTQMKFWNRTYVTQKRLWEVQKPQTWHVAEVIVYIPERTVTWKGVFKNSTKFLNMTSLLRYTPKKVLNHTLFWNKEKNTLNVSMDLFPNVTVSCNLSGTFKRSMNITTNLKILDNTMVWSGFVSKKTLVSNLTLWNRTIEFVSETCTKSRSVFLNLTTWHHVDKTAFNGSISWCLNATKRISSLNITMRNTSLYLIGYSLNSTHLNMSLYRRYGSKVYNESSVEFRNQDKMYKVWNATSLKMLWNTVDYKTFGIPTKLLNITINATSGGVNITKTGRYLRGLLQNITREISRWNFTGENMSQSIFNLTIRLLNVTSVCLPNVTANYTMYFQNTNFDVMMLWNNLTMAMRNISRGGFSEKHITEEIIRSIMTITDDINQTAFIGNLTKFITKSSWYNQTVKNVTQTMIWKMSKWTEYARNVTRNLTHYLNVTATRIGNWTVVTRTVDAILIEVIPQLRNSTVQLMNGTMEIMKYFHMVSLSFRNVTHNLSEYFLDTTHPTVKNVTHTIFLTIRKYVDKTSFLGGIAYPTWWKMTEVLNISLFNKTVQVLHKNAICGTLLEWYIPSLHYTRNITDAFHKITVDKTLEKAIEGLMNMTLMVYRSTCLLPVWNMNTTHEKLVNFTDIIFTLFNDTVNVLNSTANKTLAQIVEMYLNQTYSMTTNTWNMTKQLLYSNISQPLERMWPTLKLNQHSYNWTYRMPWCRPAIRYWNKTVFNVMMTLKYYSWDAQVRRVLPGIIHFTINRTTGFMNYTLKKLTERATPSLNISVTSTTLNATAFWPMSLRTNFTEAFYKVAYYYENIMTPALNKTKNLTNMFLNPTTILTVFPVKKTVNWTKQVFNWTMWMLNKTVSVINGSLVNETIARYAKLPNKMYFGSMNFTMNMTGYLYNYTLVMMNQMMMNGWYKSKMPFYNVWETTKTLYEMEARYIARMLTPKEQTAFMYGDHYYYTFDKRHFRFPGFRKPECIFMLARDFVNGDFTFLRTKISLIVITKDAKIEIYKDGKMKATKTGMPEVHTEMPVQFYDSFVIRDGPFIRVKGMEDEFEVECDMEHFVCGFTISGLYHNRTMGLLGTNNGERSDDWRTPLGKNRTRVEDFVNAWKIGGDDECIVDQYTDPSKTTACPREQTTRCQELFGRSDSPFKKCFDKIDPIVFLKMCTKDVASCQTSELERESHCNTSALYVTACKKMGVTVTMPSKCAQCEINEAVLIPGSSMKLTSKRQVDIVIISSEGTNMKYIAKPWQMPSFVQDLEIYLHGQGFDPRFGLVAFSGKPPIHRQGHTHTINGKFFASASEFHRGVASMAFLPSELKSNVSDGYSGLYKATQYPFRPGAKKVFILITDSIRVPDSKLTSDVITDVMKEISAKLIVIGNYRFKNIFGADSDGYRYSKKSIEAIKHKYSERLPEEDEYVKVMMKTGGGVFRMKKFEAKKSKKHTVTMIQTVLLKSLVGKKCFDCTCVADEVGKGKSICKIVNSQLCYQ